MADVKKTVLDVSPGALADYYEWLKKAQHGEVLVYWTGDLQFDRQRVIPAGDLLRKPERDEVMALNTIASRVHDDAKSGHIRLTQKRLGENNFEYRAHRFRFDYPGQKAGEGVRNDNLVPA